MFEELDIDVLRSFFIGFTVSMLIFLVNIFVSLGLLITILIIYYHLSKGSYKWLNFISIVLGFIAGDILFYNFVFDHYNLIRGLLNG